MPRPRAKTKPGDMIGYAPLRSKGFMLRRQAFDASDVSDSSFHPRSPHHLRGLETKSRVSITLHAELKMDSGEIAQCAQMRDEEWDVLYSIYPECLTSSERPDPSSPQEATIELDVAIEMGEHDIQIYRAVYNPIANWESAIPPSIEGDLAEVPEGPAMDRLESLPPLLLTLVLPIEYPMRRLPILKTVHATSDWLPGPAIESMVKHLQEIWDAEESGVLWRTCDWIRSGEFLADIGLLQDGVIRIPHPAPVLLLRRLAAHNSSALDKTFASTTFTCAICFSERKGSKCVRLSACSHVFCRECLTDFWSLHIREGDVDKVTCADPECVKEESRQQGTNGCVREEDVRRVVSDQEVARWKALKRKRELERDPTLVYCPIAVCQAPVPATDAQKASLAGSEPAPYSSLRTCHSCSFSFCDLCQRSWHGIARCPTNSTARLLQEYLAHPEGSLERKAMEQRFGNKVKLERMARLWQEEEENCKWLKGNSMQCPNCGVATEKSMGCNHMTCARCQTHFCYLCGQKLPADKPYKHFNDRGDCFGRLFEGNNWEPNGDIEWIDAEF